MSKEGEIDSSSFVRRFEDVGIEDVSSVGGKNASLGEMIRELGSKGVAVPSGFAVTADAFWHFLRSSGADRAVDAALRDLDTRDIERLRQAGERARQAVLHAPMSTELERAVLAAYERLAEEAGLPGRLDVAVRTSATAEDLPEASFAGQHETFLNVRGGAAILQACKRSFASLFTDRAISYRAERGFDHRQIALSVGVQRMVRSDLASSGVMFSLETESGFRNAVLINASYGLGENIVQGNVTPDEVLVFKPTLATSPRPILRKLLGTKEMKLVYDEGGSRRLRNVPVPLEDRARFSIADEEILRLARWACLIEEHYSAKRGEPTPMDMEWAKDGRTGELFILQARPETVHARRRPDVLETFRLRAKGRVVATGRSVGERIGVGPVRVVRDPSRLHEVREGDVLVADRTDPDWEPVMKRAAAIVTNRGGRTCHAAIVSRELGLPAVVGTGVATEQLRDDQAVTVDCSRGETGYVYEGSLAYDVEKVELETIGQPRTRMMLNVANPDEALALSFLPNDGVGLARIEFIVGNAIGIHPLALLEYERLDDAELRARIDERTAGWDDKAAFFVDRLAEGVAMIAAAFWPKDVIVRLSDFKTNEYANLLGGSRYEPAEENPMLGFRGASRYYDPRYREGFALECRAMRKVREEVGLTNLKLMVPFCRTPEEGKRVLAEMEQHGLKRGDRGLEVYVMCEIPSNVLRAEEFAEIFDGFSIGSNDLTQLVLGVDRDSEIVAHVFDERDPAVKQMIADVIRSARKAGRKIGLCGQAPSDHPDFADFLVEQGIDSISLSADALLRTTLRVLATEQRLGVGASDAR
jgi:pyruvate,water dikinase